MAPNKNQRRVARRRKFQVGDVIWTHGFRTNAGFYWFEGKSKDWDPRGGVPPGTTVYGPFKTQAELDEHQRITLLGSQCKVTDGGTWDPKWEKPQ